MNGFVLLSHKTGRQMQIMKHMYMCVKIKMRAKIVDAKKAL